MIKLLYRIRIAAILLAVSCICVLSGFAQENAAPIPAEKITALQIALAADMDEASPARKRLAVKRLIRDAEELLVSSKAAPNRFEVLEFLFSARQRLISLDDAAEHRKALLETCRELAKAPDEFADLRIEADLLVSQAELAKSGASTAARAAALRPFVERYAGTPTETKALRLATTLAIELGDSRLLSFLQKRMEERFAGDLGMIAFQRDKLGGQLLAAPFTGIFERSDGRMIRFPMDGLGRATMLVFWSKDGAGEKLIKRLASSFIQKKDELAGRLEIITFNLDELPDAGESILRGLGVDWQALRFPGGRKNPMYDAFARSDPRVVTVSPTGYMALMAEGIPALKMDAEGKPSYGHFLGSALAREWTQPRYVMQLLSLMAGDFLVSDPEGGIDPARPPELKAAAKGAIVQALARDARCVPEDTLRRIQEGFVAPPQRYRLTYAEARTSYDQVIALCRQAIAEHPEAPDLWIVRNRLIVALMGQWKIDADLAKFDAAVAEAKAAVAAGYPDGCNVVARFCLARAALRDPAADPSKVIAGLLGDGGGAAASGPALAAASLVALDAADRMSFEDIRRIILKDHTEEPMMWAFTSFLLDRHHDYWRFQVPLTAGWSLPRRAGYFKSLGVVEPARRMLQTELRTADDRPLRILGDLESEWTVIVFCQPPPWSSKPDDGLPPSPSRFLQTFSEFAASRPARDVKLMLCTLGGDAAIARAQLDPKTFKVDFPVATLPGGIANPLVQRLGILSEDKELNGLLLRKDGRIAAMVSGLARLDGGTMGSSGTFNNVIVREDEMAVTAALERGDVEAAKARIFSLAPPYDPAAVDGGGRPLPKQKHPRDHVRARARVYMALKEWDKALADAEEVVQQQLGTDGGLSLRTEELDESEALRDTILELRERSRKE